MRAAMYPALQVFIERFADNTGLQELATSLSSIRPADTSSESLEKIIDIYQQALPLIEQAIWSSCPDEHTITHYQETFRELETIISRREHDDRHSFIIVIPVADRPQHLSQCLNSLFTLCERYQYGGTFGSTYNRIIVIVAEDSKHQHNINQHRALCAEFTRKGLATEHFSASEQIDLLGDIPRHNKESLHGILGTFPTLSDPSAFYHKGAAITRNIAYLRADQLIQEKKDNNHLVYFIDSDQEFKITITNGNTQHELYAINYFYQLDKIFSQSDACILTGKVVGDPPVSPAVMASNFLDDVIEFLKKMSITNPQDNCCFHSMIQDNNESAAYHDMAGLFGFNEADKAFEYHCTLRSGHNHVDCFNDFSSKLNRFFDGEHPTRTTYFNYENGFSSTTPARTIYTGNYIFKAESLKYFIAFATLKLRMAGPVLGRLIKAELQQRFVSANLPMLHRRTVDHTGKAEFRPGVNHEAGRIDLSDEFERQYYGDIMLFTIDKLTRLGYPDSRMSAHTIKKALHDTSTEIHQQYRNKHLQIMSRLDTLKIMFCDESAWWHGTVKLETARSCFMRFISNIEYNFGDESRSYALISCDTQQEKRLEELLHAISTYADDRKIWAELLL